MKIDKIILLIIIFYIFIRCTAKEVGTTEDYFIRLYKRVDTTMYYWEAWNNGAIFTVHEGVVGERGKDYSLKNEFLSNARSKVLQTEKKMREEGYVEIKELDTLIIQYKIQGMGNTDDLTKRHHIEDLMNEELGWNGLGHCDGGDIGSGTMNVFCLVVDIGKAVDIIKIKLEKEKLLNDALMIYQKDEELEVLYPLNYQGKVSY